MAIDTVLGAPRGPLTIRIKQTEFDIDPTVSPPRITRLGISYEVVIAGAAIAKEWTAAPDASHEFQLWRTLRELLTPVLVAEGIQPPAPPRPNTHTDRKASPLMDTDPLVAIEEPK